MANPANTERARQGKREPGRSRSSGRSTFEWNGAAGVRELREPKSGADRPDESPPHDCVGEICEPMS
jgi:hypothetical protein